MRKYLIVNPEEIDKLNVYPDKRITAIKTKADIWVVDADLLSDVKTWGFAFPYLGSCIDVELTMDDFPVRRL